VVLGAPQQFGTDWELAGTGAQAFAFGIAYPERTVSEDAMSNTVTMVRDLISFLWSLDESLWLRILREFLLFSLVGSSIPLDGCNFLSLLSEKSKEFNFCAYSNELKQNHGEKDYALVRAVIKRPLKDRE